MRHRQLKQQKLAQQRVIESEAQKRQGTHVEPPPRQQPLSQPSRAQQPSESRAPPQQVQYSSQQTARQAPVATQGPPQAGPQNQVSVVAGTALSAVCDTISVNP